MTARALAAALAAVIGGAGPALADAGDDLDALIAEVRAFDLSEDPYLAEEQSDAAAAARLPSVTPEDAARRETAALDFAARLAGIPTGDLTDGEQLNAELLAWELDQRILRAPWDEARMPFMNDSGFHTDLAMLAPRARIRDAEDAEAWISRLNEAPRYYAENIANLRRAIETGWMQPRLIADRIAEGAQALIPPEDPRQSPLFAVLADMPDAIPEAEQARLREAAAAAIDGPVRAAASDFAAFMEAEYLPAAPEALGARQRTGGEDYYSFLVRHYTTTDMTPDEVHALGQSEVARIRGEMDAVMDETGFEGDFAEFLAFLRTDPQFYAQTPEALMERASYLAKQIDAHMPELFATLPRNSYGVEPVPAEIAPNYTTGRYTTGNYEQGLAGTYLVNTYALDQRPLYELPALTAHEAVPGHHHQIALMQELEDVPAFRQEMFVTAFVEGWGLYAESLGEEIGLYSTPYEQFGRLSYEMWRACRLVADTGIHWLGWSREEAEACFTENSALSPSNISTELDRYISWPGQALAYKVGELKFKELRARAEYALGDDFDIRTFHDALLLNGAMPLSLVEEKIDLWIAEQAEG